MDLPQMPADLTSFSQCFGCGEGNPIGLKLRPRYDGEKVTARFTPGPLYQGWHHITHGGIVYTMLDEITAYAVLCSGFNFGVTAKSAIRFKHITPTDRELRISAWPTRVTSRIIETRGVIELDDGTVLAEIDSTFLVGSRYARAFLWDMDGVIVDSADAHFEAWRDILATRGVTYTREQFNHYFGTRNDYTIQHVMGPGVPTDEVRAIDTEKEQLFREIIRRKARIFPGVMPLLQVMKKGSFRLGLGTSAPLENFAAVAPALGLENCFDVVVSGEEVSEGKPAPAIYLTAAERLKIEPKRCVVFEDSPMGVEAAKRAGMKCVAITNTHPAEKLRGADRVVDSLEQLELVELIRYI